MTLKNFLVKTLVCSLLTAYIFCWTPRTRLSEAQEKNSNSVEAKAECVMEMNTRRILYESHGDIRLPMASTTKILTAATVLESVENLKDQVRIPEQAEGVEGSSVYLKKDDVYTVEELLYGLMLRSGNDCATALALHCCGNIGKFAAKMNETAQKAGALTSNFVNPHGLPCKGHYTTARDLSYIACYAMHNTKFSEIVSTEYFTPRHWKNKNKMLWLYSGGMGIKTGYTKEAGRCLVSAAKRGNMTLICTVLNCPTTYERSSKLLDDAFEKYRCVQLLDKDTVFTIKVGEKKIKCKSEMEYWYPLMEEERELIEIVTEPLNFTQYGKCDKKIVGQLKIYLTKRLHFSGNLYKL